MKTLILILPFLLFGCKSEPVTPPKQKDTIQYKVVNSGNKPVNIIHNSTTTIQFPPIKPSDSTSFFKDTEDAEFWIRLQSDGTYITVFKDGKLQFDGPMTYYDIH